jgi:crossover junction endodeoxyribonuclease RuvC
MRTYIGIDPGASGGICVYEDGKIMTFNMPDTYPDIYGLLKRLADVPDVCAVLEDVGHGLPGQSSSATAKFARHNGHLEMALYALGIPTVKATPQRWQKMFSNSIGSSKGCEKREWKNRLKQLAQQMFPGTKVTLNTADAILLAVYGSKQAQL